MAWMTINSLAISDISARLTQIHDFVLMYICMSGPSKVDFRFCFEFFEKSRKFFMTLLNFNGKWKNFFGKQIKNVKSKKILL